MARKSVTRQTTQKGAVSGESNEKGGTRSKVAITLAKALSHPVRVRILTEMNTPIRRMSPTEFADRHGEHLGTISYHFRVLRRAGCIRIVEENKRRGATEHVYEPVKRAMAWSREWEDLGPFFRDNLSAAALREAVEAVGRAVDSGTFGAREESVLAHDTFWVDEEGWEEIQSIFLRQLEDLLMTTERISKRLQENPDQPKFLMSYLMASFESPVPADLKEAEDRAAEG
jgi:DNA-binding transcriptional ArsR family regulator